jgi:hypothetical protein
MENAGWTHRAGLYRSQSAIYVIGEETISLISGFVCSWPPKMQGELQICLITPNRIPTAYQFLEWTRKIDRLHSLLRPRGGTRKVSRPGQTRGPQPDQPDLPRGEIVLGSSTRLRTTNVSILLE